MKLRITFVFIFASLCAASIAATEVADTVHLDEVTVTAIKSGAVLSGTSPATVISQSEAEKLHIENIKSAADVVPNFFVPDYGSRITSSIYVRGIGARIDQPAVGLIVDNVPFLNKDAFDFDLSDIASMQVIRGPQSSLYGRNTMAGVIEISTLSPFQFQGFRAMAQYGRANTWKAGAGYYRKPSESLGLSLTLRASGTDGFFTNLATGKKCDVEHSAAARFKLQLRPSMSFSLTNVFAASWLKQGGYPYESVETGLIAYDDECSYRRLSLNDGLTAMWKFADFSISSVSSWQYLDDDMRLDQDFLPIDYFTLLQSKKENSFTQDFVIKSMSGNKYSWLAGVFGFYKHLDMDAPVTFKDTGISQLIEHYRNQANPYFPIRWNEREFPLNSFFTNPSFGLAAYHQSKLSLGNWTLTADLRIDYEYASLHYRSYMNSSYEILALKDDAGHYEHYRDVPVEIDESGRLHKSFLELLPKVGAIFTLPDFPGNMEVYASVAKGYKSGGYNTQMFSDVLQQRLMWLMGVGMQYDVNQIVSYRPEKSWNYELGARYAAFDGSMTLEGTLFFIDVRDQQLTMFPEGNTTGRIMTNAGSTHSWGFELSCKWRPVQSLAFNLAYGFTDARFRDFFDGKSQYRGNHIPYAPGNTLFIGADYTIAMPHNSSLMIDLNLKGNGKIYWNEANDLSQSFYALLGASITYALPHFSFQLWGTNLTGTRYHTFYFESIGHKFVQRGRPVEFGVTVNFDI